jgi:hypothetical protein
MSATWAITRTVRINAALSAEMTAGPGAFVVEWDGVMPRRLSAAEKRRYRKGRDELVAEYSAMTGLKILLVETA